MIISASYKTDIPTFYGEWFISRLHAGECVVVNPYNRGTSRVSLARDSVDGFVFWTKNLGPFVGHLSHVSRLGFPFIVQYAITGYPRDLECGVVDARRSMEHVRWLAETYGPRAAVWRYDTILLTSITPREWHLGNFARLADGLCGNTDQVVVSFAQLYAKTTRNLDSAAREHRFAWYDPPDEQKRQMLADMSALAAERGIRLTVCSQRHLVAPGAAPARCIDAERLGDVAGRPIRARLRGNRKDCGCYESKDIGAYDTCPHGCVYCYAVDDRQAAIRYRRHHDPLSPLLSPVDTSTAALAKTPQSDGATDAQLSLSWDAGPCQEEAV